MTKRGNSRQRHRARPKMAPGDERAAVLKRLETRQKGRASNPGVKLEAREGYGEDWRMVAPHNDLDLWELEILDAFGTRSFGVMQTFLGHLRDLCKLSRYDSRSGRWKPDQLQLNAAIAMVAENRPATATEAALVAQMVAVHWMMMRLSCDALGNGGMVMEKEAALAGKMARTYTMQLEALRALKGKKSSTRQSITVKRETHNHNHQHLHDHRTVRGTGGQENGEIPHDTRDEGATAIEGRATVRGEEPGGQVVPLQGRARKG